MSALTIAFTAGLAYKFSFLIEELEAHLSDNDECILPHLLMAEYAKNLQH